MANLTNLEKINYNQVLCDHLMKISKASESLFDVAENREGQNILPTRRSRMKSFYGQIVLLESFLWPNLSAIYHKETAAAKKYLAEQLEYNLLVSFENCQVILCHIMQEANNKGLLFPEKSEETIGEELEEP